MSGADAPSVGLGSLAPAVFLRRPNRFVVLCRVDRSRVELGPAVPVV